MIKGPFFTPHDLAERWCITTKTLRQWRWKGKGPPFRKIEGSILYQVDEIEQYENEKRMHHTTMMTSMINTPSLRLS